MDTDQYQLEQETDEESATNGDMITDCHEINSCVSVFPTEKIGNLLEVWFLDSQHGARVFVDCRFGHLQIWE